MLSQKLRVARIGFIAHVVIGPGPKPALGELLHGLVARIDVLAGSNSGKDLGGLRLCLRLGAAQSDISGLPLPRRVNAEIIFQAPGALASACEIALHGFASLCQTARLRTHPLPRSLMISASGAQSSPNRFGGTSGSPDCGRRFSAMVISSPVIPSRSD